MMKYDFGKQHSKRLIHSVDSHPSIIRIDAHARQASQAAKLERAKAILGNRWVLHPDYNPAMNAHHNPMFKTSAVLAAFMRLRMLAARRLMLEAA